MGFMYVLIDRSTQVIGEGCMAGHECVWRWFSVQRGACEVYHSVCSLVTDQCVTVFRYYTVNNIRI
jgi:hypothetical protein